METKPKRNNNLVIGLAGLVLFFLVLSVLYTVLYFSNAIEKSLQIFFPLVVLSGLFIFLVAAILLALSLFKSFNKVL